MEKLPQNSIENQEPKHPEYLKVFRFRHGSTQYTELNHEVPTDEFDLTEEGKQEIIQGVNSILSELDKDKDVIVFATSPKVRAMGSMLLARKIIEEKGFTIWQSRDDLRLIREKIRSGDTLDAAGNPIEKGQPGFSEAQKRALDQVAELLTPESDVPTAWANHPDEISGFEKFNNVGERANKEVGLLFKIAHLVQGKTDKQIVVMSFEHGETVDPVINTLGEGEITQRKGNPLKKGEPLRMDISTKDYSMKVSLPLRDGVEEEVINFDKQTKTFTKNENR